MSWSDPPPDPTNPDLLDNFRQYLINLNLVRDPRDGTKQNVLPPLWLAPRLGVPAPGQKEGLKSVESDDNMVLGAFPATDTPPPAFEGFRRINHIELIFRARTPPAALSLENKIRAAINDRRGWMMVNVPVNESTLFRGMQPIGSDRLGWVYSEEYTFELWGPLTQVAG